MVSPQGPSSFIPKAPQKNVVKPRGVRKVYVFTYLSLILFFGTLIAAIGTFFFKFSLENQLESHKQALTNERSAFKEEDLARLHELEDRIENAKQLLATHVSLSTIFAALERSTITTIQLTGVSFERTSVGQMTFAVAALATSLNDARFQRDIYAADEVLKKAGVVAPKVVSDRDAEDGIPTSPTGLSVVFTFATGYGVGDIPFQADELASIEVPSLDAASVDGVSPASQGSLDGVSSDETNL